jgi:hypothetical protein
MMASGAGPLSRHTAWSSLCKSALAEKEYRPPTDKSVRRAWIPERLEQIHVGNTCQKYTDLNRGEWTGQTPKASMETILLIDTDAANRTLAARHDLEKHPLWQGLAEIAASVLNGVFDP